MKRRLAGCFALFFCVLSQTQAADVLSLRSPDRTIDFRLTKDADESLHYVVTFRGREVIRNSPLKFSVDNGELTKGPTVTDVKRYQVNETYPWRSVHSRATNRCNGAILSLKQPASGTNWKLETRAYDDGVAFRFVVPGASNAVRVPD